MTIINKKINEIKPYENNPRKIEKAIEAVANSIKEFGFLVPVVLDKNDVVVCGHTRLKAAEKLGLTEIPCLYADDLTDEQIKAFRIADNKTAELAGWDFEKMREEMIDIQSFYDMRDFGFIIEDEPGETYISDKEYDDEELDLDNYEENNFKYECKCCGFRWGEK